MRNKRAEERNDATGIDHRKGSVKNPAVVQSGGKDVDTEAMEAVRQWRFTPASCGKDPFEAQILVDVTIHLE